MQLSEPMRGIGIGLFARPATLRRFGKSVTLQRIWIGSVNDFAGAGRSSAVPCAIRTSGLLELFNGFFGFSVGFVSCHDGIVFGHNVDSFGGFDGNSNHSLGFRRIVWGVNPISLASTSSSLKPTS